MISANHSTFSSVQFSSFAQSCPTLCDPRNHSTPGLPVHHQLPEFTQTRVHRVSDAIQPSHPPSPPSPLAPNPSQHLSFPMGRLFTLHLIEFPRGPWGFPGGSEGKASACNAGDLGSILGSGRSPGEGNGNPLQYSCLENPMDREAW